jgi:hypothetical protein
MKRAFVYSLFLALLLLQGGRASTAPASDWIEFRIEMIEERERAPQILSTVLVAGPPGTDFKLRLRLARFNLEADFLTDLIEPRRLAIKSDLRTKRLYGQSPRRLPLYEEDEQEQELNVGFDEALELRPFGERNFRIEITPVMATRDQPDRNLQIKIVKAAPDGTLNVTARHTPHRFRCEARLLRDGREEARGAGLCLLERDRELALGPLKINLRVDEFYRDRPTDGFAVGFDILRDDQPIARNWAGAGNFGEELTYDVSSIFRSQSSSAPEKYELKLMLRKTDE